MKKQRNNWEKEFDKNYDINNSQEWTLGIIASVAVHARTKRVGEHMSYIIKKFLLCYFGNHLGLAVWVACGI